MDIILLESVVTVKGIFIFTGCSVRRGRLPAMLVLHAAIRTPLAFLYLREWGMKDD